MLSSNTSLAHGSQHKHSAERSQHDSITVFPVIHTKVIHLIRHCEGYHNVAGRRDHNNYKSFDYEDAHLTPEGWRQAHALGEHVRSAGLRPQLVVVSPLARAIETAVGAFGDPSAAHSSSSNGGSGGGGGDSNGNGGGGAGGLLMAALPDVPGKCTPHAAVPLGGAPPFLCMELCREHLGVHPCDKRRPLSQTRALYPGVDFSLVDSDEDYLWQPAHRETKEEIQERGRVFMRQLAERPEREIAVVSHSSFLHYMLTNWCHSASTAVQGELHRWFENAELRTIVLADPGSSTRPSHPAHYPGFASSVVEGPQAV